jgi:hypothetical protein
MTAASTLVARARTREIRAKEDLVIEAALAWYEQVGPISDRPDLVAARDLRDLAQACGELVRLREQQAKRRNEGAKNGTP